MHIMPLIYSSGSSTAYTGLLFEPPYRQRWFCTKILGDLAFSLFVFMCTRIRYSPRSFHHQIEFQKGEARSANIWGSMLPEV